MRGVRVVTNVGPRIRWTLCCQVRFKTQTNDRAADGEVVWFWRSDAGAKPVKTLSTRLAGDGGNQAWSPGRSRISRKAIAQGRPDDPPVPVVLPRAFFLHADHGCGGHPAFPAPSVLSRAVRFQQLGRFMPRERGRASAVMSWPILRDTALCAVPQDEVVVCGMTPDPRGEEARKRRLEP